MKLSAYGIQACIVLITCCVKPNNKEVLQTTLNTDAQALSYCTQNSNTYIVVVWPKGYDHLEYIIKALNQYGSVKYIKQLMLTKKHMFLLFRALHTNMSYGNAKKFFKPYTKKLSHKIFPVAALVLQIDASLEHIVYLKQSIRKHIGEGYYSLHINDYYAETIEAAEALFLA